MIMSSKNQILLPSPRVRLLIVALSAFVLMGEDCEDDKPKAGDACSVIDGRDESGALICTGPAPEDAGTADVGTYVEVEDCSSPSYVCPADYACNCGRCEKTIAGGDVVGFGITYAESTGYNVAAPQGPSPFDAPISPVDYFELEMNGETYPAGGPLAAWTKTQAEADSLNLTLSILSVTVISAHAIFSKDDTCGAGSYDDLATKYLGAYIFANPFMFTFRDSNDETLGPIPPDAGAVLKIYDLGTERHCPEKFTTPNEYYIRLFYTGQDGQRRTHTVGPVTGDDDIPVVIPDRIVKTDALEGEGTADLECTDTDAEQEMASLSQFASREVLGQMTHAPFKRETNFGVHAAIRCDDCLTLSYGESAGTLFIAALDDDTFDFEVGVNAGWQVDVALGKRDPFVQSTGATVPSGKVSDEGNGTYRYTRPEGFEGGFSDSLIRACSYRGLSFVDVVEIRAHDERSSLDSGLLSSIVMCE